jgi:4-alpha-glucanotransferase
MLPRGLPRGYHQLRLESHGQSYETMIIASPREAFALDTISRRLWGIFVPLYAVHSGRSWGGGDFADLRAMMEWINELGGGVVATLPLLAAFLDEPFEASPYSPVSRLFWNEFYVDVTRAPELARCPRARALLDSSALQHELAALRALPGVDYRRQMAVKRSLLEELARCCFAESPERRSELERFVESHPQVEDYARFRATVERRRAAWSEWPDALRGGSLREGDYDEEVKRYHLYVQWLAHEQLGEVAELARRASQSLYLDLPVGVHPDGYDVWRERDVFVADASGGSPPDLVFTSGQNWGFPPLHPDAMRETRYRYVIAYLRHHLQLASLLRIDHVMSLHRMFAIPKGLEPRDGFYVRYRSEELYAILTLESHRYRSVIVGENLGMVPPEVNPAMTRHRIKRMYLIQYELSADPSRPLRTVPADAVASMNTHDMPPFAAFSQGLDIDYPATSGLLSGDPVERVWEPRRTIMTSLTTFLRKRQWLTRPEDETGEILRGCLAFLSASPVWLVLATLEDLWGEVEPQNIPTTGAERGNWRRKTRYAREVFSEMDGVRALLTLMNELRKRHGRTR